MTTGKQVEIRSIYFWMVETGKIIDKWGMVDLAEFLAQVGRRGWRPCGRGRKDAPDPQSKEEKTGWQ